MKSYIINFVLNSTFDVNTNPFTLTLETGFTKIGLQLLNASVEFAATQLADVCRIITNPSPLNSKTVGNIATANNDAFNISLVGTAHKFAINQPSPIMWYTTNIIILEIVDEKLPVVPIGNLDGSITLKVYLIP